MTKISQNLADVFDVVDVTDVSATNAVVKIDNQTKRTDEERQIEDDFDKARDTLQLLIKKGTEALEHSMSLAIQSDSPKAYEAFSVLLKTVGELNDRKLGVHDQNKKLKAKKEHEPVPVAGTTVTNNNVFVGSTKDLSTMIRNIQNGTQSE